MSRWINGGRVRTRQTRHEVPFDIEKLTKDARLGRYKSHQTYGSSVIHGSPRSVASVDGETVFFCRRSSRAPGKSLNKEVTCSDCQMEIEALVSHEGSEVEEDADEILSSIPTGRWPEVEPTTQPGVSRMPKTEIYKNGEDISVVTNAMEESTFLRSFAPALREAVVANEIPNQALEQVLASAFEIEAKLRGYKSNVQEQRLLAAGRWPHPGQSAIAAHDDGEEPEEDEE